MINDSLTFVDSHVHIYDCFDLEYFFNSAFKNFTFYSKKISDSEKFTGILCLTEGGDYNYFRKIHENPKSLKLKGFKIDRTSEENSIKISDGINRIFLIAGQQIVTSENLEVLALGTINRFRNGNTINETLDELKKESIITIIPWGVGKWLGKRESIIKTLISTRNSFFVGDNGNRPGVWKLPFIFQLAHDKGIYNLPGSDPLSFSSEAAKPGSFGFYIAKNISDDYPFNQLKLIVLNYDNQFNTYGKPEKTFTFLRNQIIIQINKKIKKY
jgi:hypothetical protein